MLIMQFVKHMSNSGFIIIDLHTHYKRLLHNNSPWKNLDPPLHTTSKSDAMPFKAIVTVGGHASGEAEHAAAKAALISLSLDGLDQKASFPKLVSAIFFFNFFFFIGSEDDWHLLFLPTYMIFKCRRL